MILMPQTPILFFCEDCKNAWFSKSKAKHPSCSKCHKKRTAQVLDYEVKDGKIIVYSVLR